MAKVDAKVLPDSFNPLFFDALATHFVQSWVWGEIRKKTGAKVVRVGFFQGLTLDNIAQITFHKLPKTNKTIGHLAKCAALTKEELDELMRIGKEQQAIAIRIEPNVILGSDKGATPESKSGEDSGQARKTEIGWANRHPKLKKSSQHIFVPHNFLADLTKTEEELLAAMHSKTRYNIRVAQKHGVTVQEQTDADTLEQFITLQKETSKRQKFYLHTDDYYRTVFQSLLPQNMVTLLVAKHPNGQVLSIWFLVIFKKIFTYLYGASSQEHKHMMANNLIAWEAMRLGKQLGLEILDFGGTYSNVRNPKDPRFGMHRFKKGFGVQHFTYAGTFDLIIDPIWYPIFTVANTLRWWFLRLKKA